MRWFCFALRMQDKLCTVSINLTQYVHVLIDDMVVLPLELNTLRV